VFRESEMGPTAPEPLSQHPCRSKPPALETSVDELAPRQEARTRRWPESNDPTKTSRHKCLKDMPGAAKRALFLYFDLFSSNTGWGSPASLETRRSGMLMALRSRMPPPWHHEPRCPSQPERRRWFAGTEVVCVEKGLWRHTRKTLLKLTLLRASSDVSKLHDFGPDSPGMDVFYSLGLVENVKPTMEGRCMMIEEREREIDI
jgi:hypothetical protein